MVENVRTDLWPDVVPANTAEPLNRACTHTLRVLDQLAKKPLDEWTHTDLWRLRRAKRSTRLLDEVAQLTDQQKARTDPATISRHLSDLEYLTYDDEPAPQSTSEDSKHREDTPPARQPWYRRLGFGRPRPSLPPAPAPYLGGPILQPEFGLCFAPTSRGDFCRNPAGSCPHHRR
ncbi:hypothetical protein [Mycobacterium hubeiense]|uniref:hypothetical protein n=1 Tax=Mycobacterium hubeiense TaxID=1867256 RepID=UPI001159C5BA|nr:hypothetical protein [Mycobacterium sp. QGD 101]